MNRYKNYYKINKSSLKMEIVDIPQDITIGCNSTKREIAIKVLKYFGLVFLALFVGIFVLVFVIFPIVFMNSIQLQRLLMFTNLGLPTDKEYFEEFRLPGLRNEYISVEDLNRKSNISLGLWHLLPVTFTYEALFNYTFDYIEALKDSNYSVLLYFHGTGEARSYNTYKYEIFRRYFHVITFDYRSYADSSEGMLSEDKVVNDCVQLYKWLYNRTNSQIYVWGHSLGTALATRTVAILKRESIVPEGLILEAAFTTMEDELYEHPYGKIFAWLPWFKDTVLDPLKSNGFVFNTSKHILDVDCPIMMFHAEDDPIVPVKFGQRLYDTAIENGKLAVYYQFSYKLGYEHFYMYEDPFFQYFIINFMEISSGQNITVKEVTHLRGNVNM